MERYGKGSKLKKLKTMKEMPSSEQPYEKCLADGPGVLTDAQLLSVIIRTGAKGHTSVDVANELLSINSAESGISKLMHLSVPQLMKIHGIGKVKAVQLQCIGELSRRIWKAETKDFISMSTPGTIASYYMEDMRHKEQEELTLILLNTKNKFIKDIVLTKGTVNASLVSSREIFLEAVRYRAVYLVLLHNHPSGDPSPSKEDLSITKKIRDAGALLDIQLIDHIIIGDNSYISLKERGIL